MNTIFTMLMARACCWKKEKDAFGTLELVLLLCVLIALALWLAARAMDKAARIDAGEDDDEDE